MRGRNRRPKVKSLRKLYEGLLTTSQVYRIEVLKTVLQWYDEAVLYVDSRQKKGSDKDLESLRNLEQMLDHRRKGIASQSQQEKEQEFARAICFAEKLCLRLRPYRVEVAYDECKKFMGHVAERQAKLELKYANVLQALSESLAPKSATGDALELHIIEGDKERAFSRSANEYVYNRATIKSCAAVLRRRGILPLALQEIQPLSRAAAMTDDGEGHFKIDPDRQVKCIFEMLQHLASFSQSAGAPRRLARSNNDARQARTSRLGQGRAFGRAFSGPRVAGLYLPGSAVAILYESLAAGEWKEAAELQKMVAANLASRLRRLNRDGRSNGWTVEQDGSKIRMTKREN